MYKNIEVTKDLLDYIYNHTEPLHQIQKSILEHNKNTEDMQRLQISETQGHFLQLVIKINNIKNCLEIGTSTGFSAATMALALPGGGKLVSLDHDEKTTQIANIFFKKANLDKKIETIVTPALDALKKMAKEKRLFDLVFIDADKGNYINYFNHSLDLTKKGGIIIIDNVFWHGDVFNKNKNDKKTNIIREFNSYVKNDKRVQKFIMPLGDGLTVCRKL